MEVVPRSNQIANLSAPFLAKVVFSHYHTLVQRTKDVACPIKITLSVSHRWNGNEMHFYAQRKSERDDYKATMVPN